MLAARFHAPNRPLVVEETADPTPGPGEVVIEVTACGICASDLHFIHGEMPLPTTPPVTMGHEASGTIVAVGPNVNGLAEGDRVAAYAGKSCGTCERCVAGALDECRNPQVMGIHYDGAFARYLLAPAYTLARVPNGVDMEQAAIACDSVTTPYAALLERGGLKPGERVGLWGIGGLGTHAVQIARMAGAAFIVAVDPHPGARERALALGADLALDPSDDVPAALKDATGGFRLSLAVDLVGNPRVVQQAMRCLDRGGRVVLCGQSFEHLDAGPILTLLSFLGLSILGHLGYRKRHLEDVLRLVQSGRLDLSGSITDRLPLDRVNEGVDRLTRKDESIVRLLVRPGAA
ncbi:MAG: zinc-binding dehydrogenase [Actinobacteria bacterium]|nr:zinc-binding dehydrogenase [Actinomycetota bacterium]